MLGGSRAPLAACPAEFLSPADTGALRGLVASLGTRGVTRLHLIIDTTTRGVAAERTVRAAARKAGIAVLEQTPARGKTDAVLALAGWEVAQAGLEARRNQAAPLFGTYLAPWLAQAGVVAAAGGSPLTPLPFDPAGPEAQAYVLALRQVGPTESASAAGLIAFLAARGQGLPAHDVLLYAATTGFQVMPMGGGAGGTGGMDHGAVDATWLGGGALTPVSKPLSD